MVGEPVLLQDRPGPAGGLTLNLGFLPTRLCRARSFQGGPED